MKSAQAIRLAAALVRLAERPPKPGVKFKEAIEWHRARDPILKEEWEQQASQYRRRGFTIAGITQLDLISDVHKALDRAVAEGKTLNEFKQEVGPKLLAAWGGTADTHGHRLETIFRTNVQLAYGAGRYAQATDPAVLKRRPYWGYDVIVDGRTSETICLPLANVVLPANDPWLKTHIPPLHHRCRTGLRTLTEEQARDEGITAAPPPGTAASGFGLAPDAVDSDGPAATARKIAHEKLREALPALAEVIREKLVGYLSGE